jgi:dienelactone hydrolase
LLIYSKKGSKMKTYRIRAVLMLMLLAGIMTSCGDWDFPVDNGGGDSDNNNLSNSPDGQMITVTNGQYDLRARLYIPEGDGPFPAVVIMHGCGGLWKNNDASAGEMLNQYEDWAEIFHSQEEYVALFLDSYSKRHIDEFCGINPPNDFICSPGFVRNTDAYAALDYLRELDVVIDNKVALMGFSHGGTATLSTMVDYDYVEKQGNDQWRQRAGGVWYDEDNGVMPPAEIPEDGGFVCAVSYYPGCGMFSYYGSIFDHTSGRYLNYAPILLNAAELDPLYDNDLNDGIDGRTEIFRKRAVLHGASVQNGNQVELVVYQNANHSFDGKNNGADGAANTAAKANTLDFLEDYLQ